MVERHFPNAAAAHVARLARRILQGERDLPLIG